MQNMAIISLYRLIQNQNLTTKSVSHAGQQISLLPGLFFIPSFRPQFGQPISTFTTFGKRSKCVPQDPHFRWAGLLSTPAISTFEQFGQETFSSFQAFRVGWWSTLTFAPQRTHSTSPNSNGKSPLQLGQDRDGGVTLDSTVRRSSMGTRVGPCS